MSSSGRKSPKRWTEDEDALLYHEHTRLSDPNEITDWSRIAEGVPGRSNKDCRKRWVNKVCGGLNKGPWSREEDQRLRKAMEVHGSKWTRVSEEVASRSADQCAKRWQQSLDPNIKHGNWTEEEDDRLIRAVEKHGRQWKQIQESYYQSRSRNDLKNRYIPSRRLLRIRTAADEILSIRIRLSGKRRDKLVTGGIVDLWDNFLSPRRVSSRLQPLETFRDSSMSPASARLDRLLANCSPGYHDKLVIIVCDADDQHILRPPGIMSWSQQQVPPNLQGALDGQYYPAEDPTSVHDPYYQNPPNDMSGSSMAVGGGNNSYGGSIPR
ncbi:uncharacterized protein PG986_004022 [Apiospora aurea]|uniref:Uncharacterized protein n=1 Tax=Apiospora aurea TaxID=335848 RepID=A0ABR1QLM6_9PEZI